MVCCLASEPEVIPVCCLLPQTLWTHTQPGRAALHQTPGATTGLKLHCSGTDPTAPQGSVQGTDRSPNQPQHPQSSGEIPIPIPALQLSTITSAPPQWGRAQREQHCRPSGAPRGAGGRQGWQAGLGELRGGVSPAETPLHVQ